MYLLNEVYVDGRRSFEVFPLSPILLNLASQMLPVPNVSIHEENYWFDHDDVFQSTTSPQKNININIYKIKKIEHWLTLTPRRFFRLIRWQLPSILLSAIWRLLFVVDKSKKIDFMLVVCCWFYKRMRGGKNKNEYKEWDLDRYLYFSVSVDELIGQIGNELGDVLVAFRHILLTNVNIIRNQ